MKFRIAENSCRLPDRYTPQVKLSVLKPWQNINNELELTLLSCTTSWDTANQRILDYVQRSISIKRQGRITYHEIKNPYMIPSPKYPPL